MSSVLLLEAKEKGEKIIIHGDERQPALELASPAPTSLLSRGIQIQSPAEVVTSSVKVDLNLIQPNLFLARDFYFSFCL